MILSAIISAAIAIITLIISTAITLRKNNHEERSYFEKNLKEKLDNIYSPLNLEIGFRKLSQPLINTTNRELIYKYSYLLDTKLSQRLKILIHIENSESNFLINEEYLALRADIIQEFEKEYFSLKELYNKHFERYRQRYTLTNLAKLKKRIMRICIFVTYLFFLLIGISISYRYINSTVKMTESPIFNVVITFTVFIVLGMLLLGGAGIFSEFMSQLENTVGNKLKLYNYDDKVPSTGEYQCTVCKKIAPKIAYSTFEYCDAHRNHTSKQEWNSFFYPKPWKKL